MACNFCTSVRKAVKKPIHSISEVARDILLKKSFSPILKNAVRAGRIKK